MELGPIAHLVVASAVLAWGYVLYRLVRRQRRREQDPDGPDSAPRPGGPLRDW
ncbi:hypothetical protein GCM10007079_09640 [Nocardiopsis terrae]|uniref:CcmD family protein n=1 Tax=Nocardiopsis terrae TaxID=372655 RepID=A0ABR9HD52_9ACTN|nr:hypothetical protein [Nocardiopsis terrae]MBE1456821.1 hypothetical protein [Nocardiopsis terrae]GHC74942.1 hypothetical protein GCM10007079_09640 [Nocardiopsis terrae]